MRIGIVCELQEEPPAWMGEAGADRTAEFATSWEVDQLVATLSELGHEATVIGDIAALVRCLGCGETVDMVFNYAAGVRGRAREAQVPALLEALRIPCTGADAFTLTICIDKAIIKRLWRAAALPTAPFCLLQDVDGLADVAETLGGFPLFVKPALEGSSKGISPRSVVANEHELMEQTTALLAHYNPVLVEPYLPGREFSVGLLGSGPGVEVLGVVEIGHRTAPLVDLLEKKAWEPQTFQPVADRGLWQSLCDLAMRAYQAVDCRAIGRVDIRMDRASNPYLLEINPNPGLHPTRSAVPAMARLAGLTYGQLIARIVGQAAMEPEAVGAS